MVKTKQKQTLNINTILIIALIILAIYYLPQLSTNFSTIPPGKTQNGTGTQQPAAPPTPGPSVTLDFSKNSIFCNENTIGTITSNLPNYACIIYFNKDNAGWTELKSITLDNNGHYSEAQSSATGGTYVWKVVCGTTSSNTKTVIVTCCRDSDGGIDLYTKGMCTDPHSELQECCTSAAGMYCASPVTYDTHVLEYNCMSDSCNINVLVCGTNEMCLDAMCREHWGYSEFLKFEPDAHPGTMTYFNVYCAPTTTYVACTADEGGGFSGGGVGICPTQGGTRMSSGERTFTCTFTYSDGSATTYITTIDVP